MTAGIERRSRQTSLAMTAGFQPGCGKMFAAGTLILWPPAPEKDTLPKSTVKPDDPTQQSVDDNNSTAVASCQIQVC